MQIQTQMFLNSMKSILVSVIYFVEGVSYFNLLDQSRNCDSVTQHKVNKLDCNFVNNNCYK